MTPIPLRRAPAALSLFGLALASLVDAKLNTNLPRPNPFIDPRHDPYNPLKYIASNTLTGIAFGAFLRPQSFFFWTYESARLGLDRCVRSDMAYVQARCEVDGVHDNRGISYVRHFIYLGFH